MPRYLVTKKRAAGREVPSAAEALASHPDVNVVQIVNPNMVWIDVPEAAAARLKETLMQTHFVDAEVRHHLH